MLLGSLSADGKHIVSFGGIRYSHSGRRHKKHIDQDLHDILSRQIRIFSVCENKWEISSTVMKDPRFAVQACQHGIRPFICGGTHSMSKREYSKVNSNGNLASCEAFNMSTILAKTKRPVHILLLAESRP